MRYPDGSEFIIDEQSYDHYSRDIIFSYSVEDPFINIFRNFKINEPFSYGSYSLLMEDHNGAEKSLWLDVDTDLYAVLPAVVDVDSTGTIQSQIDAYVNHSFYYSFPPDAAIGTKLVYIASLDDGSIYPANDTIAVGSISGFISYLGGSPLPLGKYEFIVAAIGHATSTPVTDATNAGVSMELGHAGLSSSIHELYGESAGFVCVSYAEFEFF